MRSPRRRVVKEDYRLVAAGPSYRAHAIVCTLDCGHEVDGCAGTTGYRACKACRDASPTPRKEQP